MEFNDSDIFGSLEESNLIFNNYGIISSIKPGDFLNSFLDRNDDIVSYNDKLFNLYVLSNLALVTASYAYCITDVAFSISKGNDNINHLGVLELIDIDLLKEVSGILNGVCCNRVSELPSYKSINSSQYYNMYSKFIKIEYSLDLNKTPFNYVIAGSCFSKLLKFKEIFNKLLGVSSLLSKDLRFLVLNNCNIELDKYSEIVFDISMETKSILMEFVRFIDSIKCLIRYGELGIPNNEFNELKCLNSSKDLVDHFETLSEYSKSLELLGNSISSYRYSFRIDSRSIKLFKDSVEIKKV